MNIEIANRLQKLRREKGLSQEELAARLGVSRQAVSKWERADSSPDTDNLICLAKIYGISLDELLNTEESVEDIAREKSEETKEEEMRDTVRINRSGIHIRDKDGSVVDIGLSGIHISDGKNGCHHHRKKSILEEALGSLFTLGICLAYILIGIFLDVWHPSWLIFFAIPIYFTLIEAIKQKRFCVFAYPVVVTGVYFLLGFRLNAWHPYWFLFLTIAPWYIVMSTLDRLIHPDKEEIKIINDDDND